MSSAYIWSATSLYHPRLTLVPYCSYLYLLRLFKKSFTHFLCLRLLLLKAKATSAEEPKLLREELSKRIFERIISHHSGTSHYNQAITPTPHSGLIRKTSVVSTSANFSEINTEFCGENLKFSLVEQGYSGKICSVKNFVCTSVNLN